MLATYQPTQEDDAQFACRGRLLSSDFAHSSNIAVTMLPNGTKSESGPDLSLAVKTCQFKHNGLVAAEWQQ